MARVGRVLLALVLVLLLIASGAALAAETKPRKKRGAWGRTAGGPIGEEQQWSRAYEIGERPGKRIIKARELLLAEEWDTAQKVLDSARLKNLNPLERAEFFRIYAFIEYGREDLDGARDYLEKTLAENALETDDAAAVRFQIGQLYLQEERWGEAAANFEKWFELGVEPNANSYYLLALAYFQGGELEIGCPRSRPSISPPIRGRAGSSCCWQSC